MNTWKAALAAVLAGLTALVTDLQGRDDVLTFRDWVIIIVAALVAGGGTWLVPPGPGITTPRAVRRDRGAHGAVSGDMVVAVAIGVFLGGLALWLLTLLVNGA